MPATSATRPAAVAAAPASAAWDPTGPGARAHLDTCRASLGSDRAVAEILGVSPSQVSRWRTGQFPDLDNADRLAGLALVAEMLSRWLAPEVREGWIHGPNAHLSGRSPAYVIRLGRVADVIGALEAEKAGVYA